jgi:hypothetical protein
VPCQAGFALSATLILARSIEADMPEGRRVTAQRCAYSSIGVRNDGQCSDPRNRVGDMGHRLLVCMDVMGELGLTQPGQALIEPVYR